MQSDSTPGNQPLVIVLLGPTASGKTDLGIAIAQALDLAVLSVDSRQLYRRMDIGTAKPTPEQRAAVRHELLDLRDPDQPINLQEFRAEAEVAIAAEHQRRGIALLVGGSGLYLKAITQGMTPPAVPPQPQLRAQLEALGQPLCHALLSAADPAAAARIMPRDAVRTQRALEVLYATGQPLSAQQGATPPPWTVLELGLNPPDLKQRIAQRSAALFAGGLVAESRDLVEHLREMGVEALQFAALSQWHGPPHERRRQILCRPQLVGQDLHRLREIERFIGRVRRDVQQRIAALEVLVGETRPLGPKDNRHRRIQLGL